MRIAIVVHDFDPSLGHGRYAWELARRFAAGAEVHVFANTFQPGNDGRLRYHRVPAVRWNALTTILSFVVPATVRIGRRFDVVHAQGLTCLRFDVITAHICNARWAMAQRAAGVARTWRQRVFEVIVTGVERLTFRHSTTAEVIAISARLRSDLAACYGRTERVEVIHHGIDPAVFAPARDDVERRRLREELGVPADAMVALFVGDLRKGAETAVAAAARVPGVELVLVSRSDAAPYEEYARTLAVRDRVHFHPATDRVASYYAAADVFLFPSPYDAFGMVVSEAMASGLPVITSRAAGASELIVHGESGFVVERADDAGAVAAKLSRLATDVTLRRLMGTRARAAVLDWTWDSVAERTMQVYRRSLGRRARAQSAPPPGGVLLA